MLGFFEIIFGQWFFKWHFHNNIIDYVSCKNSLTYWSYCPNTNAINRMSVEDGSAWIDNYVNKSSVRVESIELMKTHTKFNDYQVYITGDSFIQADEVYFNETLGYWVEKKTKLKTLHHGYSSWAPLQYYNYLSTIKFDSDDIVILFVSINDFIPENNNTNLKWYKKEHYINKNGDLRFVITEDDLNQNTIKSSLNSKSVLYQLYLFFKKKYQTFTEKKIGFKKFIIHNEWKDYEVYDDKIVKLQYDCKIIKEKYRNISKVTLDYVLLAFDEKCYDEKFKKFLDSAVNDIIKLSNYLEETKTDLIVIPYPTGFSFINENIVGKQHPYYSMSPDSIITSQGLSKYLQKRIKNKVIDIEFLLKKYDTEKKNELYFNEDGHWNTKSHQIIGKWLGDYINNWFKSKN